jgi:hypothetical protein
MKIAGLLLLCIYAAAHANAAESDALNREPGGFFATDSQRVSNVSSPGSMVPKAINIRRNAAPNGGPDDMKATSTFVQQETTNTVTPDERLIVLVALGLIVLQLQRKHRSLLQRRVTPSS